MIPPRPPSSPPDAAPPAPTTAEHPVMEQLERAGRGTRWHMSRHTLEMALHALEAPEPARPHRKGTGKARRRKRHKRLL